MIHSVTPIPKNAQTVVAFGGTDSQAFDAALLAHIPDLRELSRSDVPPVAVIMDVLEFAHAAIAEPIHGSYHSFFGHYELDFDVEKGQAKFREQINLLFSRNRLAYEMNERGEISRMGPPVLREELVRTIFNTGDRELDRMLEEARRKFLDPDLSVRRDGLEKIWDAWERVKSLERPGEGNKRESTRVILDKAATGEFRKVIEETAQALTNAGNRLMIRHSETDKEPIADSEEIDYLFHAVFAMILLLLRKSGRLRSHG
jgi:hypothetical protein